MLLVPKRNISIKVRKKIKDQESIKSRTTSDPGYQLESDKFTIRNNRSVISQQVTTRHQ